MTSWGFRISAGAALLGLLLAGCGGGGLAGVQGASQAQGTQHQSFSAALSRVAPSTSAGVSADALSPDTRASASYCRSTGGAVEIRHATYGTNNPNPTPLAGIRAFCRYTSLKDGSRIHILLTTLYATQPTLAALAYILKPAMNSGCTGNPASCYCSQLGGSDLFGGVNAAGGGWVLRHGPDETLEACIFPDMSSIDSWGLAYHTNGTIRGRDLTKVMRFKYKG